MFILSYAESIYEKTHINIKGDYLGRGNQREVGMGKERGGRI
jgi:hypothetical protein